MDRKAYSRVTVTDIVNKSGATRPTFYRYFKDRDDVLRQYLNESYEMISRSLNSKENVFEQLDYIVKEVKNVVDSKSHMIGLMIKSGCHNLLLNFSSEIVNELYEGTSNNQSMVNKYFLQSKIGGVCMMLIEWIRTDKMQTKEDIYTQVDCLINPLFREEKETLVEQMIEKSNLEMKYH